MNCNDCESNAEVIVVKSDGNNIPLCLEHFYFRFRKGEFTEVDSVDILNKHTVVDKFIRDEVI